MFFFFKQKTAYEVRISDWSSDVCSSDLWLAGDTVIVRREPPGPPDAALPVPRTDPALAAQLRSAPFIEADHPRIQRSDERRVAKEWVSTMSTRWVPYH